MLIINKTTTIYPLYT